MTATTAPLDDVNRRSWSSSMWAYAYRRAEGLYPAEAALLAAIGPALASARLLDLGIGTGRTTQALAGRAGNYIGLDYSAAMVERARARCPGLDLREGDARSLIGIADASQDVVLFSFNGLDYVDHPGRLAVLSEVRRVLTPGGVFLFSSHNRDAAVHPAWAPENLKLSADPKRFARGLIGYAHGITNNLRLRSQQVETATWALRNDPANHYGLLTYYIRPADQVAQLVAAGFAAPTAYTADGAQLALTAVSIEPFLHYQAVR
jgi:SAM-dependent methyltransferase